MYVNHLEVTLSTTASYVRVDTIDGKID